MTAEGSVSKVERAFEVNENMYRVDGYRPARAEPDPAVPAGCRAATCARSRASTGR